MKSESELIGNIYDAALDPTLWITRWSARVRSTEALRPLLYWHDVATERSAAPHLFNDDPPWSGSISRNIS
jgi:hypothetical protein